MPNWLLLIVLGAVLLTVAYYLRRPDAPSGIPLWVVWVTGLLGACALVVGVILAILAIIAYAGGKPLAFAPSAQMSASAFMLGAVLVTTEPNSTGGFALKWIANVALFAVTLLSAIGNYLTLNPSINGAWLGLSDVQWHWLLLISAVAIALYNGLVHAPPVTAPPTKTRLEVERKVNALRKAKRIDPADIEYAGGSATTTGEP